MPLDFNAIKTNLYNWASANVPVGMPVIFLYPNAPRPQTPQGGMLDYVTLLISSTSQIGWDYVPRPVDNSGTVNQTGDREFTLSVNAYGGNVLTVLENLRTSLQKQTVLDSLTANGLVFCNWFDINDITDLVDSRFEQRATMDIRFRIAQTYTDTLGTIATTVLREIIKNVDGTTVYDETVTIPPPPPPPP